MGKSVTNVMVLIISEQCVIKGDSQDGAEPLQEEATAAAQADIYKQQWQRRMQAVLQEEDAKEASTTKTENIQGYIQAAKDGPYQE